MESDLFFAEYFLGQATRELGSYTKLAGWSEEVCARVDFLYRRIRELEEEVQFLREELAADTTGEEE